MLLAPRYRAGSASKPTTSERCKCLQQRGHRSFPQGMDPSYAASHQYRPKLWWISWKLVRDVRPQWTLDSLVGLLTEATAEPRGQLVASASLAGHLVAMFQRHHACCQPRRGQRPQPSQHAVVAPPHILRFSMRSPLRYLGGSRFEPHELAQKWLEHTSGHTCIGHTFGHLRSSWRGWGAPGPYWHIFEHFTKGVFGKGSRPRGANP